MKSKGKYFVPKADSAARQIQAWARGGDYENETKDPGRHSGQLSDNITEQRVLQTRILDLARERYRTLSEREYQKNRFIDRQQKKTKMMKDLLKNIDLEQYRHKSCNTVDILKEKSFRMRLMILARHQGYELSDLATSEDILTQMNGEKSPRVEPVSEEDEEAEVSVLNRNTSRSSIFGSQSRHPKSALPTIHREPSRARISVSWDPKLRSTTAAPGRRQTVPRLSCTARPEIVKDPRCSQLLQTLTPNYSPSTPVENVSSLVLQIDTLRAQTANRMDFIEKRRKMNSLRLPSTFERVHMVMQ